MKHGIDFGVGKNIFYSSFLYLFDLGIIFKLNTLSFETLFAQVAQDRPKFEDGRADYRGSKVKLVLSAIVICDKEFLLLKRSDKVMAYQGCWMGIGGFLDDGRLPELKIKEELKEELGYGDQNIISIDVKSRLIQYDENIDTIWVIFPIAVNVKEKQNIVLDREHDNFARVSYELLGEYELLPGYEDTINSCLDLGKIRL